MSDSANENVEPPEGFDFRIRYWGVTGSFANPLTPDQVTDKLVQCLQRIGQENRFEELSRVVDDRKALTNFLTRHLPYELRSTFGGNTTCFEIRTPSQLLILDAGSGLRNLGAELVRSWEECEPPNGRKAHLLLTHGHMDHTFAIPFAAPLYDARNEFTVWAPQRVLDCLDAVLNPKAALRGTFFPATYDVLPGLAEFKVVTEHEPFSIGDVEVVPYPLNHPGGAVGYSISRSGKRLVYASDHEHQSTPDAGLAEFGKDADLLYLDAQYFDREYQGQQAIGNDPMLSRVGWGHSTVESAIATASAANVKCLHLGHHEPVRPDQDLAQLEGFARDAMKRHRDQASPGSRPISVHVVREGMTVEI